MKTIAFFGLGNMGIPIVKNLLEAGYTVKATAYKGHKRGLDEIAKYGACIESTLQETIKDADVIMSIVPDDAAVNEIYLNEEMHEAVKEHAIIVEMTSCSAETVIAVQNYYRDKLVQVIDAPVTGAKIGAEKGTLTIIGAGDPKAFEAVQDILQVISKKIYNLGDIGNGKFVKAATNLMGAVNLAMVGEIYRLAEARGLDLEQFFVVAQESAGASVQLSRNFEKMIQKDYTSTFALKLLRKDMGLALEMADHDVRLPISEFVYQIYQAGEPYADEDCSAIAKVDKISI